MDESAGLSFHIQQLVYLREAERAGTFTEAAQRLGISQPALSQSIAELERRTGLQLFEARGRRRVLTEAGREAVRFATDVLGRTAEFRSWMDDYRAGELGTLTVGMIDAASLYALPGAVRAFRDGHPEVQLRLVVDTSSALVTRLEQYELDLAFVVGPVSEELRAVEVGREPLHIYAPGGTPAEVTPDDAEWALYPVGSHTRQQIDEGFARLGIVPRVALESHNPQVLRQMVELGVGWTVLPPTVALAGATETALERRQQVAERSLLGVRRPGRRDDPRVEAFMAVALDAARSVAQQAG